MREVCSICTEEEMAQAHKYRKLGIPWLKTYPPLKLIFVRDCAKHGSRTGSGFPREYGDTGEQARTQEVGPTVYGVSKHTNTQIKKNPKGF